MKPNKKKSNKEESKLDVQPESKSAENVPSELLQPLWSIISFESLLETSMTHEQAVIKMSELAKQDIAGLCIVTDDAAKRV